MLRCVSMVGRYSCSGSVMALTVLSLCAVSASAQSVRDNAAPGEIDLNIPDAPPPTVEIDLGRDLIGDLWGLGDAAFAGFLEGLQESTDPRSRESRQFIAEQYDSARQLGDVMEDVVHELHIRVYDDLPDGAGLSEQVARHFRQQLQQAGWESVIRVREGDELVRVSIVRDENVIRGVFVLAAERDELVLVNAVGSLSPENVKQLTRRATSIAVQLGLHEQLNEAVSRIERQIN